MNDPISPNLPIGSLLNARYEITSVLGGGGFGITYMGIDTENGHQIVIKECLPISYAYRDTTSAGWVRPLTEDLRQVFTECLRNARLEAETLRALVHPGIVKIYDLFGANGTFYFTMEFIAGDTLHELCHKLRKNDSLITYDYALFLLRSMLRILRAIHEQSIFHCDIKPANIIITTSNKPKLIDFGAVRSSTLQHAGMIQITPGFTPPEFYPGRRRELGAWSDLYGLGATLYEAISGLSPEAADQRTTRDRTPRLASMTNLQASYPNAFLASIDKAMNVEINQRFQTCAEWLDFLKHYGITSNLTPTTKTPIQEAQHHHLVGVPIPTVSPTANDPADTPVPPPKTKPGGIVGANAHLPTSPQAIPPIPPVMPAEAPSHTTSPATRELLQVILISLLVLALIFWLLFGR